MLDEGLNLDLEGFGDMKFSTLLDLNEYVDITDYESYCEQYGSIYDLTVDILNDDNGTFYEDLEYFDPENVNIDDVSGDPEGAMEVWECQGDTNRCALYSQKFVLEEITGLDLDIDKMAAVAEANGWFTESGGTPVYDMNKMLDYCGVENEASDFRSIEDIKECLDNGGKVIVAVDAEEYWCGENDSLFSPGDGANHAVEVIGIDESDPENPMVILNDSGVPDGAGLMVPLDTFVDAWDDSNNYMIAVN